MTQTFKKTHKRTMTIVSLALVIMLLATFASVAPASAATCTWTHKVRPGDTLGLIAFYYGTTVNNILALNPTITDANLIFWGTNLCISSTQAPPTPFPSSYTVQLGDTLGMLAFRFGTALHDLVKSNGIGNADVIFAGETLNVPNNP